MEKLARVVSVPVDEVLVCLLDTYTTLSYPKILPTRNGWKVIRNNQQFCQIFEGPWNSFVEKLIPEDWDNSDNPDLLQVLNHFLGVEEKKFVEVPEHAYADEKEVSEECIRIVEEKLEHRIAGGMDASGKIALFRRTDRGIRILARLFEMYSNEMFGEDRDLEFVWDVFVDDYQIMAADELLLWHFDEVLLPLLSPGDYIELCDVNEETALDTGKESVICHSNLDIVNAFMNHVVAYETNDVMCLPRLTEEVIVYPKPTLESLCVALLATPQFSKSDWNKFSYVIRNTELRQRWRITCVEDVVMLVVGGRAGLDDVWSDGTYKMEELKKKFLQRLSSVYERYEDE